MPSAGGDDELRALQRKAYARDGALTAAEAARLAALEELRRAGRADASAVPARDAAACDTGPASDANTDSASGADAVSGGGPGDASPESADGSDPGAGVDSESSGRTDATGVLGALRNRRPLVLALAAVLLVAVGVGIGWAAFGRSAAPAVALTAEQQVWHNDLVASGVYDPGSVRALAVEDDVVIWTATQEQRARICLVLGSGESTMPSCGPAEQVENTGLYGSLTLGADEERQRQVSAQLLLTASGEAAVAAASSDYSSTVTGIEYANDEENATAERLAEDGFDPNSIWVAGYDGDVPLWVASRVGEGRQCLIYDGSTAEAPMTCEAAETFGEYGRGLTLEVADVASGAMTRYELPMDAGPMFLVITREGGVAGAGGD